MAHDGKAVDTDYQEDSTDDTSMHCSYSRRLFYGAGHGARNNNAKTD